MKIMIKVIVLFTLVGLAFGQVPTLSLNEFLASSDLCCDDGTGEMEDFVELYNYGEVEVDIAGLWFTDTPADSNGVYDAWQIPAGFPETVVPAGGFIALWFDKDSEQGPLHVEAKLSSDGEFIIMLDTDGVTELINFEFGPQYTDVTYAVFPDGSENWDYTVTLTPNLANVYTELILGCTDVEASNYNPDANYNDETCEYGLEIPVLFINEFLASNETGIVDTSGEFSDWIEIYNPGSEDVDLGGLYISDDTLDLTMHQIPLGFAETVVPAGGFVFLWADKDSEEGPLHIEVKLSSSGEDIVLVANDGTTIIDSYTFGEQIADISEGRESDGADNWVFFETPTPGESNGNTPVLELYINEFVASNETGYQDADDLGDDPYDDWVEIYNASNEDVDIAGMYFADGNIELHQIPTGFSETIISANGYLIIWFDKESEEGPLHIEEKLGSSGDEIHFYDIDGVTLIDSYIFGEQTIDISMGRESDGSENWVFFEIPTPNASNAIVDISPESVPETFVLIQNYPNPFNPYTTIRFELMENCNVRLDIYNINGQHVETLVNNYTKLGIHEIIWDASNSVSGIYLVKMTTDNFSSVNKMLLVK
jgi:hypothetical protein